MIYLIDDNKKRQLDSGWGDSKFEEYKNFIHPVYRLSEVTDDLRNELFSNKNNVVLFHESFFENFENKQTKDVNDIRNKLEKLSDITSNRYYVIFSGSNSERKLNENNTSASIPVHILYNNLEFFIKQYQNSNEYNLKYLLYGANPDIEPFLLEELNKAKRLFIEDSLNLSNELSDYFFFRSKLDVNPINENHSTIFNKDSEFGLHEKIINGLSNVVYKGIFVPLCFGNSLSDFNGLRLATEIRCTNTINQCTPIYIYSFVGINYLLQNEYFNILKTTSVEMVNYTKKAFQFVTSARLTALNPYELPEEIKKLELQSPKNYLDNHSIENEWAIHQWAKTIGCDETEELKIVFKNVQHNLYFKYLRTIYPISKQDVISATKLKVDYVGKPKVLLIDDEAEKGWNEILAFLLSDLNNIYTDYLGVDFKSLSSDEIIEKSIEKIFTDDIDVVILDFRLNPSDFEKIKSNETTSIKILKKIKKRNPSIQVIVFSATNKVWNLQALQEAEVDSFIFKDSSENIHLTIENLILKLTISIKKSSWLKPIWNKTITAIDHLENQRKKHILDKNFTGGISSFLQLGFDSLINCNRRFPFDSAFIYYFLILEAISKQMIDEDTPHKTNYINKHGESIKGYKFQFRSNYNFLKDFEGNEYMQVSAGDDLISNNKRIPYNPKFHNLISLAGVDDINPITIVDLRNKFNHPNLVDQKGIAVIKKENIIKIFEVCIILLKKT